MCKHAASVLYFDFVKDRIINTIKTDILVQSLLANLLILVGVLIFMTPCLENEADFIMEGLISGDYASGTPQVSVMFSHFLTGSLLCALERLIPVLPWYFIFHYLVCFSALSVITFLTLKRSSSWESRLLSLAVMIYMASECYALPGYVKTAAVTAVAASFMILSVITDEGSFSGGKQRIIFIIASLAMGLISSLISFFVFFAVFMLCAFLGAAYLIITRPFDDKSSAIRAIATGAAIAAGIVIIAAAFYYLDRLHYFKDPALSASIAYRLGYEKCLSFGIPSFKFREAELAAARDALQRLGALDPSLVDTNERLLYMAQARLIPEPHEVFNFLRFEPDNISHVPFIYLWSFLAYFLARYGDRKTRIAVALSIISGVLLLFVMRMFLVLGYYRMCTLEIIPFVWFFMLFFKDTHYRLEEAMAGKKTLIMLAVDAFLIVYLSFALFSDDLPFRWNYEAIYDAELLYADVSFDEEEDEAATEAVTEDASGQ